MASIRNGGTVVFVSFGLWFVVVFGIRIAVFGNPLYRMIRNADAASLARIEALASGEAIETEDDDTHFVRRFTRETLLQLVMLSTELALVAHLWWTHVLPWLSGALLAKGALSALVGMGLSYRRRQEGAVAVLLGVPAWLLLVERASAAVSAVGALILFLNVNGLRPW